MRQLNCELCGEVFSTNHSRQRFCSLSCRYEAYSKKKEVILSRYVAKQKCYLKNREKYLSKPVSKEDNRIKSKNYREKNGKYRRLQVNIHKKMNIYIPINYIKNNYVNLYEKYSGPVDKGLIKTCVGCSEKFTVTKKWQFYCTPQCSRKKQKENKKMKEVLINGTQIY